MTVYPVKETGFFKVVWRVFCEVRFPMRFSRFSKTMYGNFVHVFLLVYKERLNLSYRRLVEIVEETNLSRVLCIKRVPHFTTLQKFLQRVPKVLFEKLVRACHRILDLSDFEASIDGTGFSNTNPSHYYQKRVDGVEVKNFTKTVFLTDNRTKLVLNIRTHSDHASETLDFIPLIEDLRSSISTVLGDKGYDSMKNRSYCWRNGIDVHIPLRAFKSQDDRLGNHQYRKKRKLAHQLFNPTLFRRRTLIESVNSAIKRTTGSWVCSRKPENQQKQVILKVLVHNLEILDHTIFLQLFITD